MISHQDFPADLQRSSTNPLKAASNRTEQDRPISIFPLHSNIILIQNHRIRRILSKSSSVVVVVVPENGTLCFGQVKQRKDALPSSHSQPRISVQIFMLFGCTNESFHLVQHPPIDIKGRDRCTEIEVIRGCRIRSLISREDSKRVC